MLADLATLQRRGLVMDDILFYGLLKIIALIMLEVYLLSIIIDCYATYLELETFDSKKRRDK